MGRGAQGRHRAGKADAPDKGRRRALWEPQDIAELMAFLVSPAARWMTGTQLRIDGGDVKSA